MFFLIKHETMSLSVPVKLAAILSAVVLFVLSMPCLGFPKPCSCEDRKKIGDTLETIDKTRQAWGGVLADIYRNDKDSPKNMEEAKERFREKMGWTSTQKVGGLDPNTGDVVMDPDFEKQNCESIVNGVKVHEKAHKDYYRSSNPMRILFASQRGLAKLLAESEIDSRVKEATFLKNELKILKSKCRWKCKCNDGLFESAQDCARACPKPSMSCISPTCLEIDLETGKWTGKGY